MSGKTLEMTMLFDFYGDMLTEKQREYFDLYYNEDLSLGEIASNVGISRQGVRDIIVRAEKSVPGWRRRMYGTAGASIGGRSRTRELA